MTNKPFNPEFWQDRYIRGLDRDTKDVYLFLILSHRLKLSGIYEITTIEIAKHALCDSTQIGVDLAKKAMKRLIEDGKILYEEDWVFLLNRIKHQSLNPNMEKGMNREINEIKGSVPSSFLKDLETLPKGFRNPSEQPSIGIGIGISIKENFSKFWSEYPKKISKKKTEQVFDKIKPELFESIMAGLDKWNKTEQWTKDGGQFIPYPTTWLNQERWNDEVPVKVKTNNIIVIGKK